MVEKQEESKVEEQDVEKSKDSQYLYYQLLKLVDNESRNQLNKLEKDLDILANENTNDWDKLIKWDIPDKYVKARQDIIPNGIVSQYSYQQLSESSGVTFNSPKFYDYNQYLSQLVLLAQIVCRLYILHHTLLQHEPHLSLNLRLMKDSKIRYRKYFQLIG